MSARPRLLDLFCGAGGATRGYQQAGFHVVGIDLEPQPDYCGDEFIQADAIQTLDLFIRSSAIREFDAIHASPPCQDHSSLGHSEHGTGWLLEATIERLKASGLPWVCENVVGPSVTMDGWWFLLCGSMFGLKVQRHRRFGSSELMLPPVCDHIWPDGRPWTITGSGGACDAPHSLKPAPRDFWRYLDMPWMEGKDPYGVAQAIPPAYTSWIGARLLQSLNLESVGGSPTPQGSAKNG